MNKPLVSVVVPIHHEGRLFFRTKRTIEAAVFHARDNNIHVEVILVLDKPNKDTVDFIKSNPFHKDIDCRVEVVDNGNPGLTRNHGVSLAKGKYVAFVDADNLFSANWFTEGVAKLNGHKEVIVVHPQYVIVFGVKNFVWRTISSASKEFDPYSFAEHNYWDTVCMTHKSLLLDVPHDPAKPADGFGYEDWHWNCETLAHGVEHYVVSETVFFYRTKGKGSMLSVYNTQATLIPPTKFLQPKIVDAFQAARHRPQHPILPEPETPVEIIEPPVPPIRKPLSSAALWVTRKSGRVLYEGIFKPVAHLHGRTRDFEAALHPIVTELFVSPRFNVAPEPVVEPPKPKRVFPKWLLQEWRQIHELEPIIFPEKTLLQNIPEHNVKANIVTDLYWEIARAIEMNNDYLIMVPWLKKGGADLEVLNYVRGIRELHPKAKITVLATNDTDSPWKKFLPQDVRFVQLDRRIYTIYPEQQTLLLGNILVQLAPKKIHIINSPIGYRMLSDHAQALSSVSKLFLLIFCLDHTDEGRKTHYVVDYLEDSFDYITKIFADNKEVVDTLVKTYAYPREKFSVHYQPFPGKLVAAKKRKVPARFTKTRPLRILWAGRLDTQKRPDILLSVARAAQKEKLPVEFHVYGSAFLTGKKHLRAIQKEESITYHGPFDKGLETLPLADYDVFMMTSEWEGMPNVMLEASVGGLPIVAPAVGGIPEFVQSQKTGYLIDDYQDATDYLKAIKQIVGDYKTALQYVENAQRLMKKQHSWASYMTHLKNEKDYTNLS